MQTNGSGHRHPDTRHRGRRTAGDATETDRRRTGRSGPLAGIPFWAMLALAVAVIVALIVLGRATGLF